MRLSFLTLDPASLSLLPGSINPLPAPPTASTRQRRRPKPATRPDAPGQKPAEVA